MSTGLTIAREFSGHQPVSNEPRVGLGPLLSQWLREREGGKEGERECAKERPFTSQITPKNVLRIMYSVAAQVCCAG